MNRMYKGILGAWKEEDEKHSSTHVLLENMEYDALLKEIEKLKAALHDNELTFTKAMKQKENDCLEKLGIAQKRYDEQVKIAEHEKELNVYLKRILREKSNAARKLTPRQKREGYIVLYSREYDYHFNSLRSGKTSQIKVWKSLIQTMYDCGIPLRVCRQELYEGFLKLAKGCGIRSIGKDYNPNESSNQCFNLKYIANQNSRLWEIEILHTMELEIPEEYRKPLK